jgi:hypothetical protein
VVDKKRILGKRRPEEEERHKGLLTQNSFELSILSPEF